MLRRIMSVIAMAVLITGYLFFLREYEREEANEVPEIIFDMDHLDLSVTEGDSRLMEGVHAYDAEDGDLTGEIIIDSVSEFDKDQMRTVKYVVFDSKNKAATATRTISYFDYTPPRITLSDSLVQASLSMTKINNMCGAISSVDGDISNNVEIRVGMMSDNKLDVNVNVADSTGTESSMVITYDYDRTVYLMNIKLKDYLIYLNKGESYDFKENIDSIMMGNTPRPEFIEQVTIQSSVDFDKPGMYDVYYYLNGVGEGSARTKGIVVIQ